MISLNKQPYRIWKQGLKRFLKKTWGKFWTWQISNRTESTTVAERPDTWVYSETLILSLPNSRVSACDFGIPKKNEHCNKTETQLADRPQTLLWKEKRLHCIWMLWIRAVDSGAIATKTAKMSIQCPNMTVSLPRAVTSAHLDLWEINTTTGNI